MDRTTEEHWAGSQAWSRQRWQPAEHVKAGVGDCGSKPIIWFKILVHTHSQRTAGQTAYWFETSLKASQNKHPQQQSFVTLLHLLSEFSELANHFNRKMDPLPERHPRHLIDICAQVVHAVTYFMCFIVLLIQRPSCELAHSTGICQAAGSNDNVQKELTWCTI